MESQFLTASGRPVTITASTRLPAALYVAARRRAAADGVNLATFLRRVVAEALEQEKAGQPAAGAGVQR